MFNDVAEKQTQTCVFLLFSEKLFFTFCALGQRTELPHDLSVFIDVTPRSVVTVRIPED